MDWLEERIQKMNQKIAAGSMQRRLLYIVFWSTMFAVAAYVLTRNISYSWILVIANRYTTIEEFQNIGVLDRLSGVPMRIQIILLVLRLIYQYSLFPYTVAAIYFGVLYFMKNQIEAGVKAAELAMGYLAMGDLGHEQTHFARDEIGALCSQAEELRRQMVERKRQEWELQEEQSSINAAFAHDLRTPLTVMKGYTEFLVKYVPQGKVSQEMLLEKLQIMHQHENRLLEFSKTMTRIQNLEMRKLNTKWIPFSELCTRLGQTVEELEKQSGLQVEFCSTDLESARQKLISVDESLLLEVCENLLSNALRYAIEKVQVKISLQKECQQEHLVIYFQDDGKGFSDRALREAKHLYFSEDKGSIKESHFGMGLYICEKLCEKHGGRLKLINGIQGGAITAAEIRILSRSGEETEQK